MQAGKGGCPHEPAASLSPTSVQERKFLRLRYGRVVAQNALQDHVLIQKPSLKKWDRIRREANV